MTDRIADADFWAAPRLQWPGSAAEMRDALLYWIEQAPTMVDLKQLRLRNTDHLCALPRADFASVAAAIGKRLVELRRENG